MVELKWGRWEDEFNVKTDLIQRAFCIYRRKNEKIWCMVKFKDLEILKDQPFQASNLIGSFRVISRTKWERGWEEERDTSKRNLAKVHSARSVAHAFANSLLKDLRLTLKSVKQKYSGLQKKNGGMRISSKEIHKKQRKSWKQRR
jgi:hypothetical protein